MTQYQGLQSCENYLKRISSSNLNWNIVHGYTITVDDLTNT